MVNLFIFTSGIFTVFFFLLIRFRRRTAAAYIKAYMYVYKFNSAGWWHCKSFRFLFFGLAIRKRRFRFLHTIFPSILLGASQLAASVYVVCVSVWVGVASGLKVPSCAKAAAYIKWSSLLARLKVALSDTQNTQHSKYNKKEEQKNEKKAKLRRRQTLN